jgi:hypothetical protein
MNKEDDFFEYFIILSEIYNSIIIKSEMIKLR